MHNNTEPFSKKSFAKLSTKGLSRKTLTDELQDEIDVSLEIIKSQGLNIIKHQGRYFFDTKFIPIDEATFCIVDIETNGSNPEKHQIIEIAALKVKNKKIIDKFESFVKTDEINEHITKITGIKASDTSDAPELKDVLKEFKLFLQDAIFVAHDAKFDLNYISKSMQKVSLEPLLNRTLCSLALAERTISSYRYALSYLNTMFNLYEDATHHRAMSDVITTYQLFLLSLKNIQDEIVHVEDLIHFSKHAPRLKRVKFDPLLANQKETEKT